MWITTQGEFFNFYATQPNNYKNTTARGASCLEFESFVIPGFKVKGFDS